MIKDKSAQALVRWTIAPLVIALVGVALWAILASRARPTPGVAKPTNTRTQVVYIDGSLAHVYKSIGELKAASSAVVVATVMSQSSEMKDNDMYTLSTVHIDQVLWSKDHLGETAVIWQLGGKTADGSINYEMRDFPLFMGGARYVLFLTAPTPKPGGYWTTGAFQGAFSVDGNGIVQPYSRASSQVGLNVSAAPLNDFTKQVMDS
ncbi:MAG TPA: hypothetical protein VH591_15255 [Ktedonobacterales bacterium]